MRRQARGASVMVRQRGGAPLPCLDHARRNMAVDVRSLLTQPRPVATAISGALRAAAWAVGGGAGVLAAGLSVAAAHAFKGHDGSTRSSAAAPASSRRRAVRVPPAQHVPAIAGDPLPLQPPAAAPAAAPPQPAAPGRDVGRIMSGVARWPALGHHRRASSSPTRPALRGGARARSRRSSPPSTSPAAASAPTPTSPASTPAPAAPVRVGPLLLDAIAVALRAAALTDGIVDPTIGRGADPRRLRPRLRGARRTRRPGSSPRGWRAGGRSRSTPRAARCGSRGACASTSAPPRRRWPPTARPRRPPRRPAGAGVLVNLGGDIAVAGPAPAGGWPVRVADDHRAPPRGAGADADDSRSGGLATSSTTVRRWGAGAHHIIDPRTGLPARLAVAHRQRRGRDLRGRQHREHRRDRARRGRAGLARGARAPGPARRSRTAGRRRSPAGRGSSRRHDRATARRRSGTRRAAPAR